MKLLMLLGNLNNQGDANLNIAKILTDEFIKIGNDIMIMGYSTGKDINNFDIADNEIIYFKIRDFTEVTTKSKRLINLLLYKYISIVLRFKYRRQLKKTIKNYCIDSIIAVSLPIFQAEILSKLPYKGIKVIIQLDPYYLNPNIVRNNKLRYELNILNKFDIQYSSIKIDRTVYDNLYYSNIKQKIFNFPNIRLFSRNISDTSDMVSNKINIVFTGNLYSTIRTPDYFLTLFDKLDKGKYQLHFFGGGDDKVLSYIKSNKRDNITIHGLVSRERAITAMIDSDILLNINNSTPNLIPSKIYDYISTGKPIINMVKIDCCPSLSILAGYTLNINVFEKLELTDRVVLEVSNFCLENKNNNIPFNIIKEFYRDNTSKVVSENILDDIKELVTERQIINR